jgi:hypothetical protein
MSPDEELLNMPVYVNDDDRFQCNFDNCGCIDKDLGLPSRRTNLLFVALAMEEHRERYRRGPGG